MKKLSGFSLAVLSGLVALAFGLSSCEFLLPTGTVTGTVRSYTTAGGIEGVEVTVDGYTSFTATTNADGTFEIAVPVGTQTLKFSKTGYFFSDVEVVVVIDEILAVDTNTIYGQPELAAGDFRVVLTWGETPRDLDSHMITPNNIEIYYGNKTPTGAGANLDVDDTSGFGPETTTITEQQTGTYTYFVYNFTGTPSITESDAVVRVYGSTGLINTFNVPTTGTGRYWNVFTLSGSTVTPVNTVSATDPAPALAGSRLNVK